MADYVLAIDSGTTGTTAAIFDHNGSLVAKNNQEFEQIFPKPGWVEHNLDHIWASVTQSVKAAISDARLDDLCTSFGDEAKSRGIDWVCLNPLHQEAYQAGMAPFAEEGFDDIVVLAPVPRVISDAAAHLADGGVMNVFAGVARGTMADLDLSDVYLKDVRVIGHSASTIDDLRLMLNQAESGELSPNRSVAAIGSLSAAKDGLRAVQEADFPGKVIIYPHIREMPLTGLSDLQARFPTVYAKLRNGREWTVEAEREFLRLMLA